MDTNEQKIFDFFTNLGCKVEEVFLSNHEYDINIIFSNGEKINFSGFDDGIHCEINDEVIL